MDEREAVRQLVRFAGEVRRIDGGWRRREVLRRLTGGRLGRHRGGRPLPDVEAPWLDTVAYERAGWRTRTATVLRDGEDSVDAFGIDYRPCRRCRLVWVESPCTHPALRRRGLAAVALAALRVEYPGFAWYTLGGHQRAAVPFWDRVGQGVPGGYRQRAMCRHVSI